MKFQSEYLKKENYIDNQVRSHKLTHMLKNKKAAAKMRLLIFHGVAPNT